ncbi:hypothetical protein A2291_07595 [candidate division WOR-1 bacterium RIFOXYB2_FULL_42_35]|uniref:Indole-3-glycerol phosphate synthase n=1 Tax=candidate division WOR-1 bacterium RIFOXYC2_FULL_41_25 TaxID=1802586 RepID=A0A1F4TJ13_UNCSA|nr:MAG: hypothetical protein A2247_08120 [candidate division WOR-1 bacterium RIFOXYA2_FULL_41_14]OGC21788.1 MAG: hypothetical protein A2291_07595 [candidate division WOR-1 bacterium RIFOXYB2_FULL_42_35]OGC32686.1 MAG: hypothetical protein A2462_03985 [candidate division WOR-1 bacterium RIFOXYC2_FULL_41_25]
MILDDIIANKQQEVTALKDMYRGKDLASFAKRLLAPRGFLAAFPQGKVALIAEIKKASPSAGDINADLDVKTVAKLYEDSGAAALSVLTDNKYFKGKLEDLIAAKQAVNLPVLRKDFIIDEAQVYEARIAGADAVLLIVKLLNLPAGRQGVKLLEDLLKLIEDLGMQALVETHHEAEVEIALKVGAGIIGINNRDLDTFKVDFNATLKLVEKFPELKERILISESGIETNEQVKALQAVGVRGVLVGTSLLKSSSVSAKIKELLR